MSKKLFKKLILLKSTFYNLQKLKTSLKKNNKNINKNYYPARDLNPQNPDSKPVVSANFTSWVIKLC